MSKNRLQAKIVEGSVTLLSGSTLATVINLAYNVAVAHFLGPKGFGNANALYTLLTLVSAVTLSFQFVAAKIVAQQREQAGCDAAYRDVQRAAWMGGILIASLLIAFQQQISYYLHLPSAALVVVLAAGAAFYVPLGARRGYIQGAYGFRKLATNLVIEGTARLAGSVLLVVLGFGVTGVIVANSAAMAIAYVSIAPKLDRTGTNPLSFQGLSREMSQTLIFFAGQVLINNSDIVLVKHFFTSADAGLYAAIAMIGRVTFAGSSSIVNSMFPVVAGAEREERQSLTLMGTALLLVLAVGAVLALGLRFAPGWVWTTLFGSGFHIAGPHGFSFLLAVYATATTIYCLSVVVMTYEMSYKIANTSWFQLLFSAILIAGICRYHASLEQVIMVQLVLLTAFLVLVAAPVLFSMLLNAKGDADGRKVRLLQRITEDEVISEFLKSDFRHPAYRDYRDSFHNIVFQPNLDDKSECEVRRALLDLRNRALWKELPTDTQWYEAEIGTHDLSQVCVFPRAQWTRLARGNFAVTKVAERIRRRQHAIEDPFVGKIADIREDISKEKLRTDSVILIGLTESDPLTVIDGNHRLVAGILEGKVASLRFLCGLSPNMTQCCWYKTNLSNLARYGRNLLRHLLQGPGTQLHNFSSGSGSLPRPSFVSQGAISTFDKPSEQ